MTTIAELPITALRHVHGGGNDEVSYYLDQMKKLPTREECAYLMFTPFPVCIPGHRRKARKQ